MSLRELIEALFAGHRRRQAATLADNAQASYREGRAYAFMRMGGGYDWKEEDPYAYQYAKEYRKLLEEEGATWINGTKRYWFRDSTEEAKQEMLRIIEEGIAAGRPLGIKERKRGGYPAGTIAADLQPYFQRMRSHASMVARTEVGRIQNVGTCLTYKQHGIQEVTVLDNEGPHSCDACRKANRQRWTVEYAMAHELEHPNCVRRFAPAVSLPQDLQDEMARYRAEHPLPSRNQADAWLLNARHLPEVA